MPEPSKEKIVYSIGHSSLSIEDFLSHLKRFAIEILIDVRRYPSSRRHPQFHRGRLEAALARESVGYLHLGESLGGYRSVSYETYVESDEFREGLSRLESELSRPAALLCAEKHPWNCHRRFIAEALAAHGFYVRHIVDGQLQLV